MTFFQIIGSRYGYDGSLGQRKSTVKTAIIFVLHESSKNTKGWFSFLKYKVIFSVDKLFYSVQQLEEEVANIYRVHEELKQTCERREKLERAARMRLQSDLQRVQELNCVMKDQVDILQSQLLAPSEHQILIAQFFTQSTFNKKCKYETQLGL